MGGVVGGAGGGGGLQQLPQPQDDALPWYKTIASGRVQKHLMRFVNNFI